VPGKRGCSVNSSAIMAPIAHISISCMEKVHLLVGSMFRQKHKANSRLLTNCRIIIRWLEQYFRCSVPERMKHIQIKKDRWWLFSLCWWVIGAGLTSVLTHILCMVVQMKLPLLDQSLLALGHLC
jgi:hypothetical protein